ncbi:MAG TPA: hypothetical protein VH092_19755 [Urbifossiella sp.]|jgi:WD40 repeat protein|nr:hypothetical protein [Urbifossiella sp.]
MPGGLLRPTTFSPDGRRVVTETRDGTARVWDISPDVRPGADLVALAQLRSGHRINDTGTAVPLAAADLARLWTDLRSRYPDEFVPSPQAVRT